MQRPDPETTAASPSLSWAPLPWASHVLPMDTAHIQEVSFAHTPAFAEGPAASCLLRLFFHCCLCFPTPQAQKPSRVEPWASVALPLAPSPVPKFMAPRFSSSAKITGASPGNEGQRGNGDME